MSESLDIDAYLDRVTYAGPTLRPTEDVLASLVRAHVEAVPFENFDVLCGRPIKLDLASLQDKLVANKRGGYCFEQTTLFAAVLARIGFSFQAHLGRVIVNRPVTAAGRTHMLLVVRLGERDFIVDPGFGQAPRLPLPLEDRAVVRDGHEVHHVVRDNGQWLLAAGDERAPQWTTSLAHDLPIDFEVSNHYTATHPQSGFVSNIFVRAWTQAGRVGLFNRDATLWREGKPEKHSIADRAGLRAFVAQNLGFDLPAIDTLRVPGIPEWAQAPRH
jgi:N-hydroxyarylamine O-acetyltransferase